jgi:hypothetical protein
MKIKAENILQRRKIMVKLRISPWVTVKFSEGIFLLLICSRFGGDSWCSGADITTY